MLAGMTDAANELSREISADIARGENPDRPIRRMLAETGPLAGDRPAYRNEMVLK